MEDILEKLELIIDDIERDSQITKDEIYDELIENFRTMYGKGASFINPKNINEVTKTLNNLFLEKNLISW